MHVPLDGGPSDRERPSDCPVHTLHSGPVNGFSFQETKLVSLFKKLVNCEIQHPNK